MDDLLSVERLVEPPTLARRNPRLILPEENMVRRQEQRTGARTTLGHPLALDQVAIRIVGGTGIAADAMAPCLAGKRITVGKVTDVVVQPLGQSR